MSSTRTSQMFGLSPELKDAIGEWAQANDMSIAQCIREAVAEYIEYDLTQDNESLGKSESKGRPKVYENKAARREASRARKKVKREVAKGLIAEAEKLDAAAQRDALAQDVARRVKRESTSKI